jgi:hypothetical protein
MAFPIYSEIAAPVFNGIITSGQNNPNSPNPNLDASSLVAWIRLISGTGDGLIMTSNPENTRIINTLTANPVLSGASYYSGVYGDRDKAGFIGYDWSGKAVHPYRTPVGGDLVLRPSPVITAFEVKEGKDQISRHATVSIKCFSLAQCEMIQEYCMEPGHSLLIEYGWNIDSALTQLTDITDKNYIVRDAADENLNQDVLHSKRVLSGGSYDSFFGFIVGGNTSAEGDAFIISVRLRGMPGLPTFLQLQHTINNFVPAKGASVIQTAKPYTSMDVTNMFKAPGSSIDSVLGNRRYKYMFNKLPPIRQTPDVQNIINKVNSKVTAYGWWDLVNFDLPVTEMCMDFQTDVSSFAAFAAVQRKLGLVHEIVVGNVTVPKEKLVSENKYINFGVALEILNANNGLNGYKIGNKLVNVKISTKAYIGAFPGIFSTKPSKLLIPGRIPNFFEFYLNPTTVDINKILDTSKFIDNSILGKSVTRDSTGKSVMVGEKYSFVQENDLAPEFIDPKNPNKGRYFGYYEKAGYYGKLDYLYINFDLFYNTIKNSPNKSIKDVLMEMLNEMSSAVNSYWNFQIVESVEANGDITLKIIDENWAGKNTITPRTFFHSGEQSVFLEAEMDIDIPSEMANKIILAREDYTSNPDSRPIKIGGAFSEDSDMFFKGIDYVGKAAKMLGQTKGVPKVNDPFKLAGQTRAQLEQRLATLKKSVVPKKLSTMSRILTAIAAAGGGASITEYADPITNESVYTAASSNSYDITTGKTLIVEQGSATRSGAEFDSIVAGIAAAKQEEDKIANTNITANLAKIDIVPNPSVNIINANTLDPGSGFTEFNKNFKIYCCDDTQLFDVLQNNAFQRYVDPDKTGILLPIKYSFTILGKSGLRRGDIFNIWGIPKKFRDNGFFQIIEIDQSVEGMMWKTKVTGQYRQTG